MTSKDQAISNVMANNGAFWAFSDKQFNEQKSASNEPIISVTKPQLHAHTIRAYSRGMRAGLLIGLLLAIATTIITYSIMSTRLTDEARATNYYYQLSNTK